MREFVSEKTKHLECGEYEIDWKKIDPNSVNEILPFAFAFAFSGVIERQFYNSLVPVETNSLVL